MLRWLLVLISAATAVLYLYAGRSRGHGIEQRYAYEMRGALRELADAEAAFRNRTGTYAATLAALPDSSFGWYAANVRIVIDHADSNSWRATAYHDLITRTCSIEGKRTADRNEQGQPVCSRGSTSTPLSNSVRAGLAPRHEFKRWLAEP